MAQSIIIYSDEVDEGQKTVGFKIVDSKESKKYLKIVSMLMDDGIDFTYNGVSFPYEIEKFDCIKLTSSDIKTLEKLFDIDIDNNESNSIGMFPDILNDAYDAGLIDDNELENCDFDSNDDEEY